MKFLDFDICEFCGDTPTTYFLSGYSSKRVVICCDECAADVRRRSSISEIISEVSKEEAITYEVMSL
jgi:hypothetical protein